MCRNSAAYSRGLSIVEIEQSAETLPVRYEKAAEGEIVGPGRLPVPSGDAPFATDHCAQPRFGQRWECYIFAGCADEETSEDARRVGRELKGAVLKSGDAASGGRVHFTTDEPSRIEFYYGPNSERVREVVAKYDPHRLFASCNGMSF